MLIGERVAKRLEELKWSASELSRRAGVTQPTVHRIITNESQSPKHDNIEKIARALGVTSAWLWSGGVTSATIDEQSNVSEGPPLKGRVPLISWVQAGEFCEAIDLFMPGDADDWLECPISHGPNAFCLKVIGDSMFPEYREGEIILVEPRIDPAHGDDVVVRTPDGKTTFKRLQRTPDGTHLLAMNKDYPNRVILVPDDTHICGVVTASWTKRR